ncbi:MAG: sensor histidine kinase [bacterium]
MNQLKLLPIEAELSQRISWYIRLRWLAVIGVVGIVTGAHYILKVKCAHLPLYLAAGGVFFYNFLFYLYDIRLRSQIGSEGWLRKTRRFANLQISVDLFMLTFLIHFAGGVENPFIFYFIFHMVIASILLSSKEAYLQASLAVLLLGGLIIMEYFQFLPHYHLEGFIIGIQTWRSPYYNLGIFSVFITTMYLTVFMVTRVANRLKDKEKDLAIANEELKEQDRLKSRYVLTVAHDIQTTLSTIQSCLKVVLANLTGTISEKSREMIARAEHRSVALLRFVKDLLNLSKIRAMKGVERTDLYLEEIVRKTIDQIKGNIEQKHIFLDVRIPKHLSLIYANQDALEQLFNNLLTNAVKYTPWQGKVGIEIVEIVGKEGCFHTTIWDTGIGIPQEDLSRIFDDFYRGKNAEQMVKDGTGLGLSIVKQIIDEHNGDIWVESQPGKGTKFTVAISNSCVCPECADRKI